MTGLDINVPSPSRLEAVIWGVLASVVMVLGWGYVRGELGQLVAISGLSIALGFLIGRIRHSVLLGCVSAVILFIFHSVFQFCNSYFDLFLNDWWDPLIPAVTNMILPIEVYALRDADALVYKGSAAPLIAAFCWSLGTGILTRLMLEPQGRLRSEIWRCGLSSGLFMLAAAPFCVVAVLLFCCGPHSDEVASAGDVALYASIVPIYPIFFVALFNDRLVAPPVKNKQNEPPPTPKG